MGELIAQRIEFAVSQCHSLETERGGAGILKRHTFEYAVDRLLRIVGMAAVPFNFNRVQVGGRER